VLWAGEAALLKPFTYIQPLVHFVPVADELLGPPHWAVALELSHVGQTGNVWLLP